MGGGLTELVVPQRRVLVDIALGGIPPRRMELYLDEHRARAWHRQEVLDLLEGDRWFLPCRDIESGAFILINRDQVSWLAVPLGDNPISSDSDEDLELLHDHRRAVRVVMSDGHEVNGELLYDAPPEAARVVDHLNRSARFLCLFEAERLLLLNKSVVRHVAELGQPETS